MVTGTSRANNDMDGMLYYLLKSLNFRGTKLIFLIFTDESQIAASDEAMNIDSSIGSEKAWDSIANLNLETTLAGDIELPAATNKSKGPDNEQNTTSNEATVAAGSHVLETISRKRYIRFRTTDNDLPFI